MGCFAVAALQYLQRLEERMCRVVCSVLFFVLLRHVMLLCTRDAWHILHSALRAYNIHHTSLVPRPCSNDHWLLQCTKKWAIYKACCYHALYYKIMIVALTYCINQQRLMLVSFKLRRTRFCKLQLLYSRPSPQQALQASVYIMLHTQKHWQKHQLGTE